MHSCASIYNEQWNPGPLPVSSAGFKKQMGRREERVKRERGERVGVQVAGEEERGKGKGRQRGEKGPTRIGWSPCSRRESSGGREKREGKERGPKSVESR